MDLDRYRPTVFGEARRTHGPHGYVAYFPTPIPRVVEISTANLMAMADAEAALGRLAGAGRHLPSQQLLVGPFLLREAVSSARIEGTQASLTDVYDAEADDRPHGPDVEEVVNCVKAIETGLDRLGTLPLSARLIREMHAVVLAGVRGRDRRPGEFRRSNNWIGAPGSTIETAAFVPPPHDVIGDLLDDLERFVHEEPELPPLIQAALLHSQFETIHPFLDGNGRLGRLLIVLFLVVRGRLPAPLLYISPYFEQRREQYYEALQGVREHGDFDSWLAMFLDAIATQAGDALSRAERLTDLRERYRALVQAETRGSANRLVDLAFERPILTSRIVEQRLGVTRASALSALRVLEQVSILTEPSTGPRGRLRWRAAEILELLTTDTIPEPD